MCGFAGLWDHGLPNTERLETLASRMAEQLRHRGPDDSGTWVDGRNGIALGFRRLSILDLSPSGHQPMVSATGRYVIVFNGEVYNYRQLREQLVQSGQAFRGTSDTEVALAAMEEWGIEAAVRRFIGMFAMAVWDTRERSLTLIRDRLGIKPLYYGWVKDTLVFGSELKSLRAHAHVSPNVDRGALALYLRHLYIPAPFSIYEGIHKLPPGCLLEIPTGHARDAIRPRQYWSAVEVVEQGTRARYQDDDKHMADRLDSLLRDAVRLRMIADVPLGAFLSGGVDSSLVVGLMQAQSTRPVKTFTIGFHDAGFDEAAHARAVARHLGTEHTELYVTPNEAMAAIPRLPLVYDEPFADSSQIPTLLLSELTRRYVTVSLSGDGGDELFGGYSWYPTVDARWRTYGRCPSVMRHALGTAMLALAGDPSAPSPRVPGSIRSRLQLEGRLMARKDRRQLYVEYLSCVLHPTSVVPYSSEPSYSLTEAAAPRRTPLRFYEEMMSFDLVTYLPDDILTKVDRASMAVSLEARVPLLDHRVVELAWRLPFRQKYRQGQGKWILRRILDRYVPREIVERPKMGFAVPVQNWMRGPLREWADSLLDPQQLRDDGYLDAPTVRSWWDAYLGGDNRWHYPLWAVLMFQGWRDQWLR